MQVRNSYLLISAASSELVILISSGLEETFEKFKENVNKKGKLKFPLSLGKIRFSTLNLST